MAANWSVVTYFFILIMLWYNSRTSYLDLIHLLNWSSYEMSDWKNASDIILREKWEDFRYDVWSDESIGWKLFDYEKSLISRTIIYTLID